MNSVKIKFHCDLGRHLPKAFDTLDHWILLNKSNHYGFQTTPTKWFHSYLKDRYESVCWLWWHHIENLSHYNWLSTRVHLSPLLFIIYMNDIHEASSDFKTIVYVDDTNLISTLFSNSASAKTWKWRKYQRISTMYLTEFRGGLI